MRRSPRRNEAGNFLLEISVVLPFFALIFFGVVEFGRAFEQYLTTVQIARETVLYASRLVGLTGEPASYATPNQIPDPELTFPLQVLIHNRADLLLSLQNLNFQMVTKTSEYDLAENVVKFRIQASYQGLFLYFGNLPVQIEVTAPYLPSA